MLAFGLKIAWFTLSLTGIFSSLGAIPAFARTVDGCFIPILYGVTNCILQGLFCLAALVAFVALVLKYDAIQPMDGLSCDVTAPVWVRLLSYSGFPLLLALPALLLTCVAMCRFYAHSPRGTRSFAHPHSNTNDHFTPVPLRRQTKLRSSFSWHEAKAQDSLSAPLAHQETVQSIGARSTTPSGTLVIEAIPSPPSSLSSAGAHPCNPQVGKAGARYHLPFQWRPPIVPLTEMSQESSDGSSRQTPSPLVFAAPADQTGDSPHATTVPISVDISERLYEAAPWLKDEKAYLEQLEKANARKNEIHEGHDDYEAVSGPLRWIRHSADTASITKSELELAHSPQREHFEETARRPSPAVPSTYDAGLSNLPIPDLTAAVWRILLFQLFCSATQVLASITSLVDMFAQHNPPSAFGTQHFALLLAAWAPPIVFGFIPWRRKSY
ncbi:hypothetical protein BN946_scf184280.g9 [Trametes cinnabarina]|uniref:Uncharacterized protein n=1 Tax=Pycnoporus cinnabarinus TaxID=5643 RepID=A0A060SRM7_PYCCI|nr:hypothetical protein BN946_scf184280.g9 [Trametes cinnabarina]